MMEGIERASRRIGNTADSQRSSVPQLVAAVGLAIGAALSFWWWLKARRELEYLLKAGAIRPVRSSWYQVEGIRIHARVSDVFAGLARDPVVLIHGLGVSSTYFIPAAERLATSFTVFAPDLPGHGQSDNASFSPKIEDLAGTALRCMDAAGIARASVVGHSMGCQIAIEMALRNPDRITRLVLAAPTPDPHARTVARQFWRLLAGALYERPSLMPIVLKDYLRMGKRFIPEFYAMLRYPIEKKLPLVILPTLVIRGEKDPVVPQRWAEEAATLLGNERLVVIPRWGHALQYSGAPQFVRAITPFLSGKS